MVFSIGRSSNGRTAAFEAVNLGSIPSLPTESEALCWEKEVWDTPDLESKPD